MANYMLSVHLGEGEAALSEAEMQQSGKDVDALNAEMDAAGAWVFGGGLYGPDTATVVKTDTAGDVVTTDGPFAEAKEQVAGFWVIRATDLDEALAWAAKATVACRGAIEVRPFHDEPEA